MSHSQFGELWNVFSSTLTGLHGVWIQFKPDVTDLDSEWQSIFAEKVERNAADADRLGRRPGADGERLLVSFLIDRQWLKTDEFGVPVLPGERSAVLFENHLHLAYKSADKPVCYPEDHEAHILRFRTTEQEVVLT